MYHCGVGQRVFSMLDSTGTTLPEEIVIDKPDGSDKAMPWTLELYMVVSKKSHNPRFNILRVPMRNSELVNNVCDIEVVKPARSLCHHHLLHHLLHHLFILRS